MHISTVVFLFVCVDGVEMFFFGLGQRLMNEKASQTQSTAYIFSEVCGLGDHDVFVFIPIQSRLIHYS